MKASLCSERVEETFTMLPPNKRVGRAHAAAAGADDEDEAEDEAEEEAEQAVSAPSRNSSVPRWGRLASACACMHINFHARETKRGGNKGQGGKPALRVEESGVKAVSEC